MGWLKYGDKDDSFAIGFGTGGLKDDSLVLRGLWGRERLSRLYEFELIIERRTKTALSADELGDMLGKPAVAAMGPKETDLVFGILESVEVLDVDSKESARYYARLVPTVWLLTQARTNRIFQKKTIGQIVTEVLTKYGFKSGTDFELKIQAEQTPRVYVVQYEESDWDFVSRWLEREGWYYWFEHDAEQHKEKLVIADSNHAATAIAGTARVPHRGYSNLLPEGEQTVWDWHEQHRRTSARVALLDYNDEAPTTFIQGTSDVDAQGFGTVFSYGEHLVDAAEAGRLAKVRAERIKCQRDTFSGHSDCSRLRVGHSFEFAKLKDAEPDKYLVTAIEHRVGYPLYGAGEQKMRGYQARFDCIPLAEHQFRPPRVTPWPRIDGVLRGHIESLVDKYATLDDQGRYQVRMPFDLSGSGPGQASCWIRLAQPYSGPGYGTHFPLHRGAEVLIAFVQGDPDRPVLVGAIPNPATQSPVIDKNLTESVMRTNSGIHIELEDLQS